MVSNILSSASHRTIPVIVGSTNLHPDDGVRCASGQAQFGQDIEVGFTIPIIALVEVDADNVAVTQLYMNIHIIGLTSQARWVGHSQVSACGRRILPVVGWLIRRSGGSSGAALQTASPVTVGARNLNPLDGVTRGICIGWEIGMQMEIEGVMSRPATNIVVEVECDWSRRGVDAHIAVVGLTIW